MPAPKEVVLEVAGRQVTISNPDKIFFPKTGHTKLDLVRYYIAVAEGALRGVSGRPMALKRFVNGAEGEAFFQKRAPTSRPEWIDTVELSVPSGRTADEIVVRAAGPFRRSAARLSHWRGKWSGARPRSPPAAGGRRNGTACSSTTTRTPRTGRSPPPTLFAHWPTPAFRHR